MNTIQCWSINNEDFTYTDFNELMFDMELVPGDIVYVGEASKPKPSDFYDTDYILDMLAESAYDLAGEYAEGFPDVSTEAVQELKNLLDSWIEKNCFINFYRVDNVKEYVITKEDLL